MPSAGADDDRPHVLVVGGGPIGLEAAVSCRFAGLRVTVAERGPTVASSVRAWSFVRLFSQNSLNNSADGLRALEELGCPLPASQAYPTGGEYADGYLEPLARWLAEDGDVRCSTRVDSISRGSLLKGEAIKGAGDHARDSTPFAALLVDETSGEETVLDNLAFANHERTASGGDEPESAAKYTKWAQVLWCPESVGKKRRHGADRRADCTVHVGARALGATNRHVSE